MITAVGNDDRVLDPAANYLAPDYKIEVFASALNFSIGITLDENGAVYVLATGRHSYGKDPSNINGKQGGET